MKQRILALLCCLQALTAYTQTYSISGAITDGSTPLEGVTVQLTPVYDTNTRKGYSTDTAGRFIFTDIAPGQYTLSTSYVGFQPQSRQIDLLDKDLYTGTWALVPASGTLQTVTIKDQQVRARQLGDTTEFNADAYKTHPDATAEDLVRKMPGVSIESNTIKVNGEEVKQVFVDGKPFFGEDPSASLRNLPAEIVEKVQMFDNRSDQAKFTGFDDGNSQKTINLSTRKGKNTGQFGKIYAGYGTDSRYNIGGNLNIFDGTRRISVIAQSNNINQQNFSIADVMSVMSNSGNQQIGPPPMGGRTGGSSNTSGGNVGFGPGGLLVGQQSGITQTNAVGINYSDNWGSKINVSGSYFYNATDNTNESELTRHYFSDTSLVYDQHSNIKTQNTNHRVNMKIEYKPNESDAVIFTPKLSYQKNNSTTDLSGNTLQGTGLLNNTSNNQSAQNEGYNFSGNILLQHKFPRQGRTISLNIGSQIGGRNGDGNYYSQSQYGTDTTDISQDQHYNLNSNSHAWSAALNYTEPIGRQGQIQISYNPSYTSGSSDKETFTRDPLTDAYTVKDTTLSNQYDNRYTTQQGGVSYRLSTGKINFSIGSDLQYAQLDGDLKYPVSGSVHHHFTSVLPNAMLQYRLAKSRNLRLMYRSSANAPAVTQLQNVADVSNPLKITTGNPELSQTEEHNLMLHFGNTNIATSKNFFAFINGNYTRNYIGNANYIALTDTVIHAIRLNKGSQLSIPVNMNGYYSARAFAVYSFPVSLIKSNLNLNAGVNYTHTPTLINDQKSYTHNTALSGGWYLSSNISSNLDFSLSYNGSYNIARNSANTASNSNYFSHNTTFRINAIVLKGITLSSDITNTLYDGLGSDYDQSFYIWNAAIGYKFLKDRSLEVKISGNDLLRQNSSLNRTVSELYREDSRTKVLQQYFLLTLTYTLRNFKNGTQPSLPELPKGFPPPGHMPPPGG